MVLWILPLSLGIFVLLFFIIISINFKGFLKEIFKSENYIKFIQFLFVIVLLFIFVAIFVYFWINEIEVNNMVVIFTVIVGWLGLIIGAFFGQKFMEDLTKEKKELGVKRTLLPTINDYENLINRYKNQTNDLSKIIGNYKELYEKKIRKSQK